MSARDLFFKPLMTLTPDDVAAAVASEIPESDTVEFKQQLSAKGRDLDPWERGEDRIGDRARNELLEEVIAFANAYGGHVVLGIEESAGHPKRAVRIHPVQRCAELAERLRLQLRDCIEPPLPIVEVWPIATTDDGAGVIVFRVGQSLAAPHRLQPTRECTVRRADRCERMTMREIQDLTLHRAGSGLELEAEITRRREGFVAWLNAAMFAAGHYGYFGVRVTGIPTMRVQVPRLALADVQPCLTRFFVGDDRRSDAVDLPVPGWSARPIVRGRRFDFDCGGGTAGSVELTESGIVEYFMHERPASDPMAYLLTEWPLATLANALAMVHTLRIAAEAPAVEYAIDFEVRRENNNQLSMTYIAGSPTHRMNITPNPLLLPRYSFGSFSELGDLVGLAASDLLSAGGVTCEPSRYRLIGPTASLGQIERGERMQ